MEIALNAWQTYFDDEGYLIDEYKLRKTSFYHCICEDTRKEAWPFLLSLWERDSSSVARQRTTEALSQQYVALRDGWINAEAQLFDDEMKQSIKTIDKDVRRTERKHPFFAEEGCVGLRMLRRLLITLSVYDPELAYVQGMNEICAPILLTLQDESLTFWCFVQLLPALRPRLLTLDISPQLSATADLVQYFDSDVYHHIEKLTAGHWLFCFRWYLLVFKNEFKLPDILKLWDVIFSQHNTAHFEIFVGAAIIIMHKEQVLACGTSDQLLHFAQSVTAKLPVDVVINYSRDLSVKLCSSEGLSESLAALVKQVDKVPPPLVGFVRRRQCFNSVFSGRLNMNDEMIRSLLSSSNTAQTTPLFFNCTESPVPIPSQNYLSGIQGVQLVGVADAPQLAPPPTTSLEVSPLNRSRQRRPDALLNDRVSTVSESGGGSGGNGSDGSSHAHYGESNYGESNYDVTDKHQYNSTQVQYELNTHHPHDATNNPNHFSSGYQGMSHSYNDQSLDQQYTNSGQGYQDTNHNYPNTGHFQNPGNWNEPVPSNGHSKPWYDRSVYSNSLQGTSADHVTSPSLPGPNSEPNKVQHCSSMSAEQHNTSPLRKGQDSENSVENNALNIISDDMWDMKISVHTNDALS